MIFIEEDKAGNPLCNENPFLEVLGKITKGPIFLIQIVFSAVCEPTNSSPFFPIRIYIKRNNGYPLFLFGFYFLFLLALFFLMSAFILAEPEPWAPVMYFFFFALVLTFVSCGAFSRFGPPRNVIPPRITASMSSPPKLLISFCFCGIRILFPRISGGRDVLQ